MLRSSCSLLMSVFVALLACPGLPVPAAGAEDAAAHLELVTVPDGRCQILSEGGKLRVLHNRHASRPIDYRLLRTFPPGQPQGLVAGTIPAGPEPHKLGCTRVDGREQDWLVKRARYAVQEQ
jgi:hypothetical protein